MTNSRTRILRSTQNGHFWEVYVKHYTLERRRRKSHSPHGQTVRFLRLETALKSGPPPSMAEMHRKVRHSKTSAECKTAARPHQSRCSSQPEGLMPFLCRAFPRLTNAGKQVIVLVSGIFFASDHHGGIGVLNAIQNGRSLIL